MKKTVLLSLSILTVSSLFLSLFSPMSVDAQERKFYDSAMAVDPDENVYIVDEYAGRNDSSNDNRFRVLKVSPYNQVNEYYETEDFPRRDSHSSTKLGKLLDDDTSIDDMWWGDGNLYMKSGDSTYRIPNDNNDDLEKVTYDEWHEDRIEEDEHRENSINVWRESDNENHIIVDRVRSDDGGKYNDPQYISRDELRKKIEDEANQRLEEQRRIDQQEQKEQKEFEDRMKEIEEQRRRDLADLREAMKQSITRIRASVSGSSKNAQSQRAVTDGNAFSDQEQSQNSEFDYQFSID